MVVVFSGVEERFGSVDDNFCDDELDGGVAVDPIFCSHLQPQFLLQVRRL